MRVIKFYYFFIYKPFFSWKSKTFNISKRKNLSSRQSTNKNFPWCNSFSFFFRSFFFFFILNDQHPAFESDRDVWAPQATVLRLEETRKQQRGEERKKVSKLSCHLRRCREKKRRICARAITRHEKYAHAWRGRRMERKKRSQGRKKSKKTLRDVCGETRDIWCFAFFCHQFFGTALYVCIWTLGISPR